MGNCSSCCGETGIARDGLHEPLLADSEREAVNDLLQYFENRDDTDFFSGEPLRALTTLVYSNNVDLQISASLAFAELTERGIFSFSFPAEIMDRQWHGPLSFNDAIDVREVDRDTLELILFLLHSPDINAQQAACVALGNLAVNTENKVSIVLLGGLVPLIRKMMSPEVQCNAVGCITNLSTHKDNKAKIARSGALVLLIRLAESKDIKVQRNATGALLNMTHSDDTREQLVNTGAIPVLVQLLSSQDIDVQYYCTTALGNIAVDAANRKNLAQNEGRLVQLLVHLMDSTSSKVQCGATAALRNLAGDEEYQLEIVRARGLPPLLKLLQSSHLSPILSAVACIRNISAHPLNISPIIDAGLLKPLVDLLGSTDNEEIQCNAIETLKNIADGSDRNDLKSHLLNLGVFDVLIPLSDSESIEVQRISGATLGYLLSKVGDYSILVRDWEKPNGGIHGYLRRFLASGDSTFQRIAIWTLFKLLESGDKRLTTLIEKAEEIVQIIKSISDKNIESDSEGEEDGEVGFVTLVRRSMKLLVHQQEIPTSKKWISIPLCI